MRTRIIAAFPGTGKTYYHEKHKDTTLDSDSSHFSWITKDGEKVRNPDFPNNYIEHIRNNIGKYEFIFVSTHKEVREALLDNCIFFYLIYPDEDKKQYFLDRYRKRNSPEAFIKLLDDNWEKWIRECVFTEYGCQNKRMTWLSVENELQHIVASEHGDVLDEDEQD